MKKNSFGFSIIEVIISTVILTVGVFGVYKLIGNNMNAISNNEILVQLHSTYIPFRECIKGFGYNHLTSWYNSGDIFSVHFGSDNMGCFTGNYDTQFNFSGTIIDNQTYYMFGKVTAKGFSGITLDLNIFNPSNGYLFQSGIENNDINILKIKQ